MNTVDAVRIAVSITQVIAIFVMYWLAVRQYQMNQSSQYLNRFLDKELFELRESVDLWLESGADTIKKLEQLNDEECRHTKSEAIAFANFFQELAISYQRKLTHRRYIYDTFGFLAQHYWERLNFWVCSYRDEKNRRTLYAEWESLYNEFKRLDERYGK